MSRAKDVRLEAFLSGDADETDLRLLVDRLDNEPDLGRTIADETQFLGMLRAAEATDSQLGQQATATYRVAAAATGIVALDRTHAVMAQIASKRPPRKAWMLPAAVLAIAATIVLALSLLPEAPPECGVVTLAGAGYDLVRNQSSTPLTAGTRLHHGDRIRGGGNTETITITSQNGTRIAIAGAVDVICRRDGPGQHLILKHGILNLDVTPQPAGYPMIILTDLARATVVGTTLRIRADADATRLDVSSGAVLFANAHEDRRVVEANQFAVARRGEEMLSGSQSIMAPPPPVRAAYARWQEWSRQLSADPDLVVHYAFSPDDANRGWLINQAPPPTDPIFPRNLDGRIHQCTWSDGRFPGLKHSLLFQQDAYVNCGRDPAIPTDGPITCLAWFKPLLIRSGWTGIVTTGIDGWGLQLNKEFNSANFYYKTALGHENARSTQALTMNEWHLAVGVFDGTHTHVYLDGNHLSSYRVEGVKSAFLDPLMIGGNFTNQPARSFQGWIDEVAVLKRAMTATEIATAYAAGKPK